MSFTLYIANNCNGCKKVLEFIQYNNICCTIINCDEDEGLPPLDILIFPALFRQENLIAYGADINTSLEKELKIESELIKLSQQFIGSERKNSSEKDYVTLLSNFSISDFTNQLNTDEKRLVFWINIYNALSIYTLRKKPTVLSNPITRKLHFMKGVISIDSTRLSLDDIEHKLIRSSKLWWAKGYLNCFVITKLERQLRVSYNDPRIHFALNCGGQSCPTSPYLELESLDEQLNSATKNFLSLETTYNQKINTASISKLFNWYIGDFGGKKGVISFLQSFDIIAQNSTPIIKFNQYNW
jgi:hypothetical protein